MAAVEAQTARVLPCPYSIAPCIFRRFSLVDATYNVQRRKAAINTTMIRSERLMVKTLLLGVSNPRDAMCGGIKHCKACSPFFSKTIEPKGG
jgi:hypothetical protein